MGHRSCFTGGNESRVVRIVVGPYRREIRIYEPNGKVYHIDRICEYGNDGASRIYSCHYLCSWVSGIRQIDLER